MVKISVGTAGWDYKDWHGPFYPINLNRKRYLEFYSNYFDIIEVNSSFYNLPSVNIVNNWAHKVPQNFRYIIKVWQQITHKLGDYEISSVLNQFFERFKPLEENIAGYLFQFPPRFKYTPNSFQKLIYLINELPKNKLTLYIIELRHTSWFNFEILSRLIDDSTTTVLGTTYLPGIIPYYLPKQRYYYIRLIGDRKLKIFNRIQRIQKQFLNDLVKNINHLKTNPKTYEIFIIVNNHFQGLAPQSANLIKKQLNLPFKPFNHQKSLEDFLKKTTKNE